MYNNLIRFNYFRNLSANYLPSSQNQQVTTPLLSLQNQTHLYNFKHSLNTSPYLKIFSSKKMQGGVFFFSKVLTNPLLTKYSLLKTLANHKAKNLSSISRSSLEQTYLAQELVSLTFGQRLNRKLYSNLQPTLNLKLSLKKRIYFKLVGDGLLLNIVYIKYKMLIDFMESATGRKIAIRLNPTLERGLTLEDRAQCRMWEPRINGFKRFVGPRIFIYEALHLVCLSFRLKDPTFLAN